MDLATLHIVHVGKPIFCAIKNGNDWHNAISTHLTAVLRVFSEGDAGFALLIIAAVVNSPHNILKFGKSRSISESK